MDEIHNLHWHGKYGFQDVMDMTARERIALSERTITSMKSESKAYEKALKGK